MWCEVAPKSCDCERSNDARFSCTESDTMIVTENKSIRDTIILQEYDTITLERNAVRVKIQRINDTIRVDAECLSDTIRIQEEIRVPQIVYQEKKFNSKYLWILLVSIIIYTLVLLRLTK